MAVYYHVSRRGPSQSGIPNPSSILPGQKLDVHPLIPGKVIQFGNQSYLAPPDWTEELRTAFPEGVTRHGIQYGLATASMAPIELPYELVRRLEFPHALSRFQAVFGSRSISEAHDFAKRVGSLDYAIWEVEADYAEEHDMNLLSQPVNLGFLLQRARQYWRQPAPGAFIEILLRPPVLLRAMVFDSQLPPGAA